MKPTTADVLNTVAALAGSLALINPDAVAAVAGPQWAVYALALKGVSGIVVDTFKRVQAARVAAAAAPTVQPENKP